MLSKKRRKKLKKARAKKKPKIIVKIEGLPDELLRKRSALRVGRNGVLHANRACYRCHWCSKFDTLGTHLSREHWCCARCLHKRHKAIHEALDARLPFFMSEINAYRASEEYKQGVACFAQMIKILLSLG